MAEAIDVVTGGAGFIGSHLCRALLEAGRSVRIVDNLATGDRARLKGLLEHYGNRCAFLEQDIREIEGLRKAFEGAEVVYHQAAVPSVPRSVADPVTSNTANVDGTLNVFLAARDAGVRKVVYASSSSIYGDSPTLPKHEGMPLNPLSPYAVTKCAGEMYGRIFTQIYELPTVGLRYFNIFGPSQDPTSQYAAVIPRFLTAMLEGRRPTIFGDGEQSRDFTYVANAVAANLMAADADTAGLCMNVACGERFTLNQLVTSLNEILGTELDPRYEPPRPGDVKHSEADISRARELIGYEPKVGFREGLRRTAEWFRSPQEG